MTDITVHTKIIIREINLSPLLIHVESPTCSKIRFCYSEHSCPILVESVDVATADAESRLPI